MLDIIPKALKSEIWNYSFQRRSPGHLHVAQKFEWDLKSHWNVINILASSAFYPAHLGSESLYVKLQLPFFPSFPRQVVLHGQGTYWEHKDLYQVLPPSSSSLPHLPSHYAHSAPGLLNPSSLTPTLHPPPHLSLMYGSCVLSICVLLGIGRKRTTTRAIPYHTKVGTCKTTAWCSRKTPQKTHDGAEYMPNVPAHSSGQPLKKLIQIDCIFLPITDISSILSSSFPALVPHFATRIGLLKSPPSSPHSLISWLGCDQVCLFGIRSRKLRGRSLRSLK